MNKKIIIGLLIAIIVLLVLSVSAPEPSNPPSNKNNYSLKPNLVDRIEVVHFHATQQCWACITIGEYALKTVKERFPEEYKDGTIVFSEINVDLPKNKEVVMKYQARGSSLFINSVSSGNDNIEEDITVWRLVANEEQFLNYLESKINKLLGKS